VDLRWCLETPSWAGTWLGGTGTDIVARLSLSMLLSLSLAVVVGYSRCRCRYCYCAGNQEKHETEDEDQDHKARRIARTRPHSTHTRRTVLGIS